jgi:hypothetical protein
LLLKYLQTKCDFSGPLLKLWKTQDEMVYMVLFWWKGTLACLIDRRNNLGIALVFTACSLAKVDFIERWVCNRLSVQGEYGI